MSDLQNLISMLQKQAMQGVQSPQLQNNYNPAANLGSPMSGGMMGMGQQASSGTQSSSGGSMGKGGSQSAGGMIGNAVAPNTMSKMAAKGGGV